MRGGRALTVVPFGAWAPDLPPIGNPGLVVARNIVPLTEGSCTAMPSLAAFHDPLPAAISCQYSASDSLGAGYEWGGDGNKLWGKSVGRAPWLDATGTSGPYSPAAG